MDATEQARREKKKRLLSELAELMIEEQVEEGVFLGTPHFSVIEAAAVNLGNQLSREAQERAAGEIAASCGSTAPCPTCAEQCEVTFDKREVTSISGVLEMLEAIAYCRKCRRSFFPSAGSDGNG
jgi:hypothetical protein